MSILYSIAYPEPVLFLTWFMYSYSMVMTQQYTLFRTFQRFNVTAGASACAEPSSTSSTLVEAEVSAYRMQLAIFLIGSLVSIPFSILHGQRTDLSGRRWGIGLPSVGLFGLMTGFMIVDLFHLPLTWMVLVSGLTACMGSFPLCSSSCLSYVTDCSSGVKDKSSRFVVQEVTILMGVLSGFATSYLVLRNLSFLQSFMVALAALSLSIIYAFFLLKESLLEGVFKLDIWHKFRAGLYSIRDLGPSRTPALLFASASIFIYGLAANISSSLSIYLAGKPLCFKPETNVLFTMTWLLMNALSSSILFPIAKRYNWSMSLIVLSMVSLLSFGPALSLSTSMHQIFIAAPLAGGLTFIALPLLRYKMTVLLDPQYRGLHIVLLISLEQLGSVILSPILGVIYQTMLKKQFQSVSFTVFSCMVVVPAFCYILAILLEHFNSITVTQSAE